MVDRATQSHRFSDLSVQVARLLLRDVSPKLLLKIGHLVTTEGITLVEKDPRAVAENGLRSRADAREREASDALRLEEEHHAAVVGTMHRLGRSACRGDGRKRPRSG